mgnify:CR=1 FL=1
MDADHVAVGMRGAIAGDCRELVGGVRFDRFEIVGTRGKLVLENNKLTFTRNDADKNLFAVAERIMVLHQGRVIADGRPDEVRADPQVQKVYLGEAE